MLWLTVIALIAAFYLWIFSPDLPKALWATVATVVFGFLVVELTERRTRNRRGRRDRRAVPRAPDRRRRRSRRQDDNIRS
jgi:peptidoglycan/LPS O-acetylase OafA/YrhL